MDKPGELLVGEAMTLQEGQRRIVSVGTTEIGVYRVNGQLFAYENLCAHQGGPACEGLLMPRVLDVISDDKTYQGRRFDYDEWHIVCPWHGWEYELTTGTCVVNKRLRLRKYAVVERDGRVYVITG